MQIVTYVYEYDCTLIGHAHTFHNAYIIDASSDRFGFYLGDFGGGMLFVLGQNKLMAPKRDDVHNNFVWVHAPVCAYPDRVPSGYFLADCFLRLHVLLNRKVFHGTPMEIRNKAMKHGILLKRIIGAMRTLKRSSDAAGKYHNTIGLLKRIMSKKTVVAPTYSSDSSSSAEASERSSSTESSSESTSSSSSDPEMDSSSATYSPPDDGDMPESTLEVAKILVETPPKPIPRMQNSVSEISKTKGTPQKRKMSASFKRSLRGRESFVEEGAPIEKVAPIVEEVAPMEDGKLPVPLCMPEECLPQGVRRGKYSYTIKAPTSGAVVEVLLKGKAFMIKKTQAMSDPAMYNARVGLSDCGSWSETWAKVKSMVDWS